MLSGKKVQSNVLIFIGSVKKTYSTIINNCVMNAERMGQITQLCSRSKKYRPTIEKKEASRMNSSQAHDWLADCTAAYSSLGSVMTEGNAARAIIGLISATPARTKARSRSTLM